MSIEEKKETSKDEAQISEEVKITALEYSPTLIKKLVQLALNPKTPASCVIQASQIVLDRGLGKAKTHVEVNTNKNSFIEMLRGLNTKGEKDIEKGINETQLSLIKEETETDGKV